MIRRAALGWIVIGCCACSSPQPAAQEARPVKRPRATWSAPQQRTPPPPDPTITAPSSSRVQVTVGQGRPAQGWAAPPGAQNPAPPGAVTGYDLVRDPDPHCPGWVAVPNYELAPPTEDENAHADAGLPAGHDLKLPPPPEREPAAATPPTVKETLRPTEVGR